MKSDEFERVSGVELRHNRVSASFTPLEISAMRYALRHSLALVFGLGLASFVLAHDGDPKLLDRRPMYPGTGFRNAHQFAPSGNPGTIAPLVSFPKSGVTLLAWLSLPDLGVPTGGNGNSCFGYTSGSGREYAIMGLSTGTAFVEITQPGNPVIAAQIAGPQSLWRDMKVFQHWCYAISEGGSGIQVMDLAQIDSGIVTLVNTVDDDATHSTHTLALDADSGYLYRDGGGPNGLRIYDLNANPASPARAGTWPDRYVHEAQVVRYTSGPAAGKEIAFCCGGLNGGFNSTGLDIVDVTNKSAPVYLRHVTYPNPGYSHQAWLSPDRQLLYLDDELDEQTFGIPCTTHVFNTADPANTVWLNSFTNGNTSIGHNLYTKGSLIYEANYRSGLRVLSTASPGTPTAPVEVAFFDTWPEDNNANFNGLWNDYPYFPSGVVIGSDIEKGLFVWWVGTPQLTFTFVPGIPSLVDPGGQLLRVDIGEITPGALQANTARLHYDIGSGFVMSDLLPIGGTSFEAVLPPIVCGREIRFYVTAQSTNGVIWSSPEGAPEQLYSSVSATGGVIPFAADFESGNGWTGTAPGDTAIKGLWTRVDPIGTSAQPEDDHSANPGTLCWVTGQGSPGAPADSADVDGGFTTLTSPVMDLSSVVAPVVSYWRWYSNNQGIGTPDDQLRIDISNNGGASWVNVETLGPSGADTIGGWIFHQLDVSSFVTPTAQVKLRCVASDTGVDGIVEAALDDFRVSAITCSGTATFCAGDGTGTPCPCGNTGSAGRGCATSFGVGALLSVSGTPSVGSDSLVLSGSSMPAVAAAMYVQGDAADGGGLGFAVGDGLRCATGNVVRLGSHYSVGGASSYPSSGGDLPVSQRGGVLAGETRYYQVWLRNAANFCTSATFNWSNGLVVNWGP